MNVFEQEILKNVTCSGLSHIIDPNIFFRPEFWIGRVPWTRVNVPKKIINTGLNQRIFPSPRLELSNVNLNHIVSLDIDPDLIQNTLQKMILQNPEILDNELRYLVYENTYMSNRENKADLISIISEKTIKKIRHFSLQDLIWTKTNAYIFDPNSNHKIVDPNEYEITKLDLGPKFNQNQTFLGIISLKNSFTNEVKSSIIYDQDHFHEMGLLGLENESKVLVPKKGLYWIIQDNSKVYAQEVMPYLQDSELMEFLNLGNYTFLSYPEPYLYGPYLLLNIKFQEHILETGLGQLMNQDTYEVYESFFGNSNQENIKTLIDELQDLDQRLTQSLALIQKFVPIDLQVRSDLCNDLNSTMDGINEFILVFTKMLNQKFTLFIHNNIKFNSIFRFMSHGLMEDDLDSRLLNVILLTFLNNPFASNSLIDSGILDTKKITLNSGLKKVRSLKTWDNLFNISNGNNPFDS